MPWHEHNTPGIAGRCVVPCVVVLSLRDDGEVDAFAHVRRGERKWSIVRHSVGHQSTQMPQRMQERSSITIAAAYGPSSARAISASSDIAVDRVDAIGRDHFDAAVRAGIDAAVAENAAIAVDEDVELALQAALGLFEPDRLGVAGFDFERRVAAVRCRDPPPAATASPDADAGVVVAPDQAPAHRGQAPLGDAFGDQRVRGRDELGRNAGDLHLLDLGAGAAQSRSINSATRLPSPIEEMKLVGLTT